MKLIALFLATITAARAFSVFGDGIGISPGFVEPNPVLIAASGSLTLLRPGTYTAASWSVSGELRLAVEGTYIIVATNGSISLNASSKLVGPGNSMGTARVTFVPAGGFLFAGITEGSVLTSQGLTVPGEPPPLVNISTRSTLAAGQTLSSGFVIGGKIARRVLMRAVGPTLSTFGVTNPLPTPTLAVFNGQTPLRTNAGWAGEASLAAAFSSVGAFALPSSSRDAAILMTLSPGSYTVQVGGGAGEVLAEIYLVE